MGKPALGFFAADIIAVRCRAVRFAAVFQQIIDKNRKDIAQHHQLFRFRKALVVLPFADGLAGGVHLPGKLLLRETLFLSELEQFFSKCHGEVPSFVLMA